MAWQEVQKISLVQKKPPIRISGFKNDHVHDHCIEINYSR